MYTGTKRRIFVALFPEIPQTETGLMYVVCVWCYKDRDRVTVTLDVLLYSILSVQIVYSLQLNCTYSYYTKAAATSSAAQQHSTFTVQILYKL